MKREDSQKRLEALLNEALFENQPIVEFKDSFAFDITFKLKDMVNFLLDNGVDVHYMKDGSVCWKVDTCNAPEEFDCISNNCDCEECKYNIPYADKINYRSCYHDSDFGVTIFSTKEEAEAKVQEIYEERNKK